PARAQLGDRGGVARAGAEHGAHRLPAAVRPARVLGHQRGREHHLVGSDPGPVRGGCAARRRRLHGHHAEPLLRHPHAVDTGADHRPARRPSVPRGQARHHGAAVDQSRDGARAGRAGRDGRTRHEKGERMTRVFVAGATGAVGKRLVPQLVESGHEVIAMTRSEAKAETLRKRGVETAVADGLDREAVIDAVAAAMPEIVVHEMTALAGVTNIRNFDRQFALTNRLRTEGTDHLLAAAKAVGARRFVAQSFGNWYERSGRWTKTEEDPMEPDPPAHQRRSLAAIRRLEETVLGADGIEGVVLRYAALYGPGTDLSLDGKLA